MAVFLTSGFIAFSLSLLMVYLVRTLTRKYNWCVAPSMTRWHQQPTALYGGLGIFFAFMATTLIALQYHDTSDFKPSLIALVVGGGGGSVLLGFFDDLFSFKPSTKLVVQIVLASLFILISGYIQVSTMKILNILLTYFWFIGIINAVNLLDNMDGLAAGVVIISGTVLMILMALSGHTFQDPFMIITFIFVMSVLGFWFFNFHPASIFMGDTGSLFLGYTLAALAISDSVGSLDFKTSGSSILTLLIPVTILAIPIFDTTLVTLSRKFSGRPIMQGGRDHSSHLLVGLGFSERMSVAILYTLTAIGGVTAIFMILYREVSVYIFGAYFISLVVFGLYLSRKKIYSHDEALLRKEGWTPLVGDIAYKKGFVEIALDIFLVILSYFFACLLCSGMDNFDYQDFYSRSLPIVILTTAVIFRLAGMYRSLWDLLSLEDIYLMLKVVLLTGLSVFLINTFILGELLYGPLYVTFGLILFFSVVGSRVSFRLLDAIVQTYGLSKRPVCVILYGAGFAGKLIVDEIKRNKIYRDIRPIGFVDDDLRKQGRYVSGVKILGGHTTLVPPFHHRFPKPHEVWISSTKIGDVRINYLRSVLPQDIVVKKMSFSFVSL